MTDDKRFAALEARVHAMQLSLHENDETRRVVASAAESPPPERTLPPIERSKKAAAELFDQVDADIQSGSVDPSWNPESEIAGVLHSTSGVRLIGSKCGRVACRAEIFIDLIGDARRTAVDDIVSKSPFSAGTAFKYDALDERRVVLYVQRSGFPLGEAPP